MSSVLFLSLVLGTLCLELSVKHREAQGDHIVSGVEEKLGGWGHLRGGSHAGLVTTWDPVFSRLTTHHQTPSSQ